MAALLFTNLPPFIFLGKLPRIFLSTAKLWVTGYAWQKVFFLLPAKFLSTFVNILFIAQCVHWTVFPPRPSEVGHTVQSHNCHIFVPIRSVKGKLTKSDFCESQTSNSKCNFPQIFPNYSPNSNGVFSATTGVFVGVFEPGREKTIHTIQWLVNTLSTG